MPEIIFGKPKLSRYSLPTTYYYLITGVNHFLLPCGEFKTRHFPVSIFVLPFSPTDLLHSLDYNLRTLPIMYGWVLASAFKVHFDPFVFYFQ